ncbi:MAG: hypothetical protein J6T15_04770 [Bacilli bacterium]|nr:hypothetical protein [Bacilli bacterium]
MGNYMDEVTRRLQEYIDNDELYQKVLIKRTPITKLSDEDCLKVKHCLDIDLLLQENKGLKNCCRSMNTERDSLIEALAQAKRKHNGDKAKYRRKANKYRKELRDLQKSIKK